MRRLNAKVMTATVLAVLALVLFPVTALAAPPSAVVIGNSYTLQSGASLHDDLFVLGGNVNLMSGSTVTGNIFILGGNAQAAGTVTGNILVLGGTLNLSGTFILNGNLTYAGTAVVRDPGAQIHGQINSNGNVPTIVIPGQIQIPNVYTGLNPFFKIVGFFLRLFLWALGAMVLAMFLPSHLTRISQTVLSQPIISGGMGLLTAVVVPIILVLLAITICLIPVSLIGILILVAAWIFGLISLGFEVGKRISSMSKVEWHPAISAGIGTLLLMVVLNGVDAVIPCIGWIPKVVVGLFGLGAVILTQFGINPYTPTPTLPESNTGASVKAQD